MSHCLHAAAGSCKETWDFGITISADFGRLKSKTEFDFSFYFCHSIWNLEYLFTGSLRLPMVSEEVCYNGVIASLFINTRDQDRWHNTSSAPPPPPKSHFHISCCSMSIHFIPIFLLDGCSCRESFGDESQSYFGLGVGMNRSYKGVGCSCIINIYIYYHELHYPPIFSRDLGSSFIVINVTSSISPLSSSSSS